MKNYSKLALRTDHKSYEQVASRFSPSIARLTRAGLGLSTEANEFCDQLKKHIVYGKELDKVNLIEELGDLCRFIAMACDELGTSFEEIQEININKLKARKGWQLRYIAKPSLPSCIAFAQYCSFKSLARFASFGEKYTDDKALNRDLENERQILESKSGK